MVQSLSQHEHTYHSGFPGADTLRTGREHGAAPAEGMNYPCQFVIELIYIKCN